MVKIIIDYIASKLMKLISESYRKAHCIWHFPQKYCDDSAYGGYACIYGLKVKYEVL